MYLARAHTGGEAEGLSLVHVQGGCANPSILERTGQRVLVDQTTARRVHQEGTCQQLIPHAIKQLAYT